MLVSTAPTAPLFGGGLADIAFLLGVNPPPADAIGPNAQTVLMRATFWIETVVYQIEVPPIGAGDAPLVLGWEVWREVADRNSLGVDRSRTRESDR